MRTIALALVLLAAAPAPSAAAPARPAPDPNQKVCQVITPVGSRLATKKICATRAEWEEQKRLDRAETERAQTQLCVVNPTTGKC